MRLVIKQPVLVLFAATVRVSHRLYLLQELFSFLLELLTVVLTKTFDLQALLKKMMITLIRFVLGSCPVPQRVSSFWTLLLVVQPWWELLLGLTFRLSKNR